MPHRIGLAAGCPSRELRLVVRSVLRRLLRSPSLRSRPRRVWASGRGQAYTTLATFPTLRAPIPRCKSFVEDKKIGNTKEVFFNAKGALIPVAVSVFPG